MNNILVTGGAGFIGSNFIRALLTKEPRVHIFNLDALTYSGSLENLHNLPDETRYSFIKGDICDAALVNQALRVNSIDTIVHFAAESHVDRSIVSPGQFIQTNIIGTFTLLEAARHYWTSVKGLDSGDYRFHHISTDEVFGALNPGEPAWTEDIAYAPNSPYAASKAASDHLVRAAGHTYGLPYTLTNCSNNYGPYQFPEKLIPLMILNALEGKPLPVYGDGNQIRDWLHVEDHCEAIYLVLKKGKLGSSYNIGGGNQPTNLTIIYKICDLLDELSPEKTSHRDLIQFVKDRPGHDRRYAVDWTKAKNELGYKPLYNLDVYLEKTIKWYQNNEWWWKELKSGEFRKYYQKQYGK